MAISFRGFALLQSFCILFLRFLFFRSKFTVVRVQMNNPWLRRPAVAIGAIGQLCLLLLLTWLSSDHLAHHRLHHLVDSVCKICSHHNDPCDVAHDSSETTAQASDSHTPHNAPDDGDEDCVITLFAHGHANLTTMPVLVEAPVPIFLFLNGSPVAPALPPSTQLLPYSCGPPILAS